MAVQASPDAVLVQEFANTRDLRTFVPRGREHRDGTRDDIATPEALSTWLATHGLLGPGTKITGPDHTHLLELRATLRAALDPGRQDSRSHEPPPFSLPLQIELDPRQGPRLTPTGSGVTEAIAKIGAAALRTAITGEWWRLRVCAADDCHWVFYDQSKPGRGRYCAPDSCGNRVKTRAYRQRRKAEAGSPHT